MPRNSSLFRATRYTSRKKGGGAFKFIFLSLLLAAFAAVGYWGYNNRERVKYFFKRDKHQQLEERLEQMRVVLAREKKTDLAEIATTEELLRDLANDQPADGHIFYLRGEFYQILFEVNLEKNTDLYRDLFFHEYINRYRFPAQLNREHWDNAMLSYRKALALHLPSDMRTRVGKRLARLCLWGGSAYWRSGMALLKKQKTVKGTTAQLFRIIIGNDEPKWKKLRKHFDQYLVDFWRGIYQLKSGNEPLAYSILNDIVNASDAQEPAKSDLSGIQNNSRYLLAEIMKKQKKKHSQLRFYQDIDLDEFLPRNPWFLKEINYLLRFLGKNAEASSLLNRYEKMVLGKS